MNLPVVECRKAIQGLDVNPAIVPFLIRAPKGLGARIPHAISMNWADPSRGRSRHVNPTTTVFILRLLPLL